MFESFEKMKEQFMEYYNNLDKKKKMIIGGVSLGVIIFLIIFVILINRNNYITLYNNIEPSRSGEIMNVLNANNIDAKIGRTSSEILVEESDLQNAEIIIATQGLPSTKSPYDELFGNSLMMTSEERRLQYQIALQKHLENTIQSLNGVRSAEVSLSIPERTGYVFDNNGDFPTATVTLNELDRTLEMESIEGIAILVSNAVEGLKPENVSVHGPDGRVLNLAKDDNTYEASDKLSLQRSIQEDLEESIKDFLGVVYGRENVSVTSRVRLDFDSRVIESKSFSPPIDGETEGIPRSLQEFEKRSSDEFIGGIPGTDTNIDTPEYVEGDETSSIYEEASRTINYEINEINEKIVRAKGQVEDVSIAVYINSNAEILGGEELTEGDITELTELIASAAGVDTEVVRVAGRPFAGTEVLEIEDEEEIRRWWQNPVYIILLIAVLIIGIIIGILLFRRRKEEEEELEENPLEELSRREEEDLELDMKGSQVKQQLEKLVENKPDAVAKLLKNWLNDE